VGPPKPAGSDAVGVGGGGRRHYIPGRKVRASRGLLLRREVKGRRLLRRLGLFGRRRAD